MGDFTYGFNPGARALRTELAKGQTATPSAYDQELGRVMDLYGRLTPEEVAFVKREAPRPSMIKAAHREVTKARGNARIVTKGASSSGGLPAGVGPTFVPAEPLDFGGSMADLAARPPLGMFEDATQTGITFKLNGSSAATVSLDVLRVANTLDTQGFSVPAAVLKRAILDAVSATSVDTQNRPLMDT